MLVIAFLPRSRHLLISWLQSPSAVILEPKKRKSVTVSIVSPSICHEVMGPAAMILVFWMLSLSQLFHSPLSLSSGGSSVPLCFLPWGWCHLHVWGLHQLRLNEEFMRALVGVGVLTYSHDFTKSRAPSSRLKKTESELGRNTAWKWKRMQAQECSWPLGLPWWLTMAKNLPIIQETQVRSLDGKESPREGHGNPL